MVPAQWAEIAPFRGIDKGITYLALIMYSKSYLRMVYSDMALSLEILYNL